MTNEYFSAKKKYLIGEKGENFSVKVKTRSCLLKNVFLLWFLWVFPTNWVNAIGVVDRERPLQRLRKLLFMSFIIQRCCFDKILWVWTNIFISFCDFVICWEAKTSNDDKMRLFRLNRNITERNRQFFSSNHSQMKWKVKIYL